MSRLTTSSPNLLEPINLSVPPESLSTENLVQTVTLTFAEVVSKLRTIVPYVAELRKRFAAAPRGNAGIAGCKTWTEFCQRHLNRTTDAVAKALQDNGGNPASIGGIETACEFCGELFPSKGLAKRHTRKQHAEKLEVANTHWFPIAAPQHQPAWESFAGETTAPPLCTPKLEAPILTLSRKLSTLLPIEGDGQENVFPDLLQQIQNADIEEFIPESEHMVWQLRTVAANLLQAAEKLEEKLNVAELAR